MPMYIIARNALFGEIMFPDMDPSNEASPSVVEKMEELYCARMYAALSDQGYTWFPDTSELGQERDEDDGRPEIDEEYLKDMFRELSEETVSEIFKMDEGELEAAYSLEC